MSYRGLFRPGRWIPFALIVVLMVGAVLPIRPAQAQAGQTISDLLSLGANTVREVQETIPLLQGAILETVEGLRDQLEALLNTISQTYQENLNVTLASLDTFTREKFTDLQRLMDTINQKLQEDVQLISQEAQNIIRTASDELTQLAGTLQENLSSIIVVGGETAAFVVDRAFHNALVVISLVLLGLGLLAFVWSLFRRSLPQAGLSRTLLLVFMIAFVGIFGSIAFVPSVRAFVMTNTGLGLKQRLEKDALIGQPRLLRIFPTEITAGKVTELEIWGTALLVNNAPPQARIGNQDVPVKTFQADLLVLDITGLGAIATGSVNVVLTYPDNTEVRGSVRFFTPTATPVPPDLTITALTLEPSQPQAGQTVTARVTVRNQGGSAGPSTVKWFPCADIPSVAKQSVGAMSAGQAVNFVFTHTFTSARTNCQTQAVADFDNQIAESDEANNLRQFTVNVRAAPTATPTSTPVPTRQFTVTVRTGDRFGAGTDANVFITLTGTLGSSPERQIDTANFNDFEGGASTSYAVDASKNIGTITGMRLRHDNTGIAPGWFVNSVTVRNTTTGAEVTFSINRWFARDEDDGAIDRTFTK